MYYIIEILQTADYSRFVDKINIIEFSNDKRSLEFYKELLNINAKKLNDDLNNYEQKFNGAYYEELIKEEQSDFSQTSFQKSIFNKIFTKKYLDANPMSDEIKLFYTFQIHKIGIEMKQIYRSVIYHLRETNEAICENYT